MTKHNAHNKTCAKTSNYYDIIISEIINFDKSLIKLRVLSILCFFVIFFLTFYFKNNIYLFVAVISANLFYIFDLSLQSFRVQLVELGEKMDAANGNQPPDFRMRSLAKISSDRKTRILYSILPTSKTNNSKIYDAVIALCVLFYFSF